MLVFVTGATGFIGSYLLAELKERDHSVRCLVRGSTTLRGVEVVRGDVTRPSTLEGAMDGCDAAIHLVGIIDEDPARSVTYESLHVEATRTVVREALRAGVQRFVQMSANSASSDGVSRYQITKWQAEELVREAGFGHWTILRPGIVFGEPPPGTIEFCTRLAREMILPLPVVPLFGRDPCPLQPVSVQEVAAALAQGIELAASHGRTVVAVGQEPLPLRTVIDRITEGLGRKVRPKLVVPPGLMRLGIRRLGPLGVLPISMDQLEMLLQGNVGDPAPFYDLFDLTPMPFTLENLAYLKRKAW